MGMFDEILKKTAEPLALSFAEAKGAMDEVMLGKVSPVKLAAWLTALRVKGETADEIAGFAASLRANSLHVQCKDPNCVDTCGTGGDGLGTLNISTAAAFIAAGAGVTVAKHGNRAASSQSGSADVLAELGVNVNASKGQAEKSLNSDGVAFLFAQVMHPAMRHAMPVRKELGFRTAFNLIGPLSNPASSKRAVIGVFSADRLGLMAEAALRLGFEHAFIVHSRDGMDEISVSAPTDVREVREGKIFDYVISPEQFGMPRHMISDLRGGSAKENAAAMMKLFTNNGSAAFKDVAVLNAAAAIVASGKMKGWTSAILAAKESLENGSALAKLENMIRMYEA